MQSKRTYKSGTGWCFWRWTYTPSGYITRLHVYKTTLNIPLLSAVCVHFINGPDPEPDMHDHPVTFLSLILWGGYTEKLPTGLKKRRWFNFIRGDKHVHAIVSVKPNTVTLALMGPKWREWGFHTKDGWVFWKDYNKKYKNAK